MRILAVTNQSPFPVNNGQRVRTSLFLEAMKVSNEIDLVIYDYQDEPLPDWFNQIYLFSNKSKGRISDIKAHLSGKSAYVTRFKSKEVETCISNLVKSNNYDRIISLALPGMVNIPEQTDVPIWLDDHNIEYEIYREYGKDSNIAMKIVASVESKRLQKWELEMIDTAEVVSLCSSEDQQKLDSKFHKKCKIISNSCPDSGTKKQAQFSADNPSIIYSGTMGWKPNVDACIYFLQEIWPHIKSTVPAVTFTIVGKDPSKTLIEEVAKHRDVSCTGFVESTDTYHSSATVSVVPLRMGSGTRIKIIEAAQFGIPVISTSKGAEGLHFKDNEEIFIRDDPEEFAQNVINIITEKEYWNECSIAISNRFEKEYSRNSVISQIQECMDSVLRSGGHHE